MKRQIFKIGLISFITLCFFSTAYATLNIETEVDVPASCAVTDTNGVIHNYPQTDSPSSYLAICALEKALEQNVVNDIDFADFGFGLFINSVNNISQNNTYWQLRLNNISASVGASDLILQAGDIVSLILTAFDPVTFVETPLEDQVTLHINLLNTPPPPAPEPEPEPEPVATPEPVHHSSGGYIRQNIINPPIKQTFDLKKAFNFLISEQKENGSFGEDLYTDWATLALASGDFQDQEKKIIKYFEESKTTEMSLTDYERHTMALMALGLNPYNTNSINYIEKIITGFDGTQFGDINEDNDDIFALIVLQNAGYDMNDKIINTDISFILNKQKNDGSWDGSVDMTGAAIEALAVFSPSPGVGESLEKAKKFLEQNQKDNGGWNNNASSTAWAIEGILALNEKIENWINNGNTPLDYLATIQDIDGGIKNLSAQTGENINNKIWETAYVVSVLSNKTWNQIMQKFEKPKIPTITKVTVKTPKKIIKKESAMVATAIVINATTPISTLNETEQKETKPKGWFVKLLDSIFSIF